MLTLRPYQQAAVDAFYQTIRDKVPGHGLIEHATGLGKSVIIAKVAADMHNWGRRVLILAHVAELLEQNHAKLQAMLPEITVGLYSAGLKRRDINATPLVAGIQSIHNKAAQVFPPPDVAIIDECHLLSPNAGSMYRKFLSDLWQQNPKMRLLGLTATPYRLKGGCLISSKDSLFSHTIHKFSMGDGIREGYLSPVTSKASPVQADLTGVTTQNGDFNQAEMAARFSPALTLKALEDLLQKAHDRRSILIFAANVEHAEFITECLDGAAMVDGSTPKETRARLIEDFRQRRLRFLVNVNVLTTGFDAPNVDCIGLLRATKSPGLYVQIVGRGTRKAEGKQNCLLLDFGGNIERFGPVEHIKLRKKSDGSTEAQGAPVKTCPKCEEKVHAGVLECPACHFRFPAIMATHQTKASEAAVLEGIEDDIRDVSHWFWERHKGKGGKPDTVQITYFCGLAQFRQWLCPEHEGYARRQYLEFATLFKHPIYKTVDETLKWFHDTKPKPPSKITVKRNPTGYWNVLEHKREYIYGQETNTVGRGQLEKSDCGNFELLP